MTESPPLPSSVPYVVVPTYQEAENIETVVTAILSAVPQAKVLVVDDASPDGTSGIALRLKEGGIHLDVIVRDNKAGLGSAYRAGFRRAIDEGASACVEIDADLSHDPAVIPQLLNELDQGADLAIGSRYVRGGSSPGLSAGRLLISRLGNVYASFTLGIPAKDTTSGFRAFRRTALEAIDLTKVRADGYAFQVEMAHIVHQNGGQIVEVPITFKDRLAGGSKMSARIVIEAMILCTIWGGARYFTILDNTDMQDCIMDNLGRLYERGKTLFGLKGC